MHFCFGMVECVTTASPLLDQPTAQFVKEGGMSGKDQFVIRSGGKPVLFKMKAEDAEGRVIDFSIPLVYASTGILGNATQRASLIAKYNDGVDINNRVQLQGQSFALAARTPNSATTTFSARDIQFHVQDYLSNDEPQGFLPLLKAASILEPTYQRITGQNVSAPVELVDDRNPGHVFAKFIDPAAVNFAFQSDKTGGLAAPNFQLSGLSKATGAFGGDIQKFMAAHAEASDYFNVSNLPDPTLFGVFKLSELLDFGAAGSSAYDLDKALEERVPKVPNLQTRETSSHQIASYVVHPGLKEKSDDFVRFKKRNGADFAILTEVKTPKGDSSGQSSFISNAYVLNFDVSVVKVLSDYLISIHFDEVRFFVEAGKKADVSVRMSPVPIEFGGPLKFINAFTRLIDPQGFYDPPYVDVSLTGIKCGYTLDLPGLQMGAFTLSNLGIGAEVNLPFSGAPLTIGFRFCERHQPFTLTISCLGGGGFFGFELDLHGIRQIEAALEFGAAVSLNFGVASGNVSVMAGIYFKMILVDEQNSTQLTGYVRINGSVSVLGLITASIELYMELSYLIDSDKAFGEASLKIKVEVLFFSKTVTIRAQRSFAGSGDDPNFQMAITQDDWLEYCSAFAA